MSNYWYLASPYSQYKRGLEEANKEVCEAAGYLISIGIAIFCPIAHSHTICKYTNLSNTDHDLWMRADSPLMEGAEGLIVYTMEGWDISRGVTEEIIRFTEQKKPIQYLQRRDGQFSLVEKPNG